MKLSKFEKSAFSNGGYGLAQQRKDLFEQKCRTLNILQAYPAPVAKAVHSLMEGLK